MKYIRNILLNFKRKLILILIGLFALFVKGKVVFHVVLVKEQKFIGAVDVVEKGMSMIVQEEKEMKEMYVVHVMEKKLLNALIMELKAMNLVKYVEEPEKYKYNMIMY